MSKLISNVARRQLIASAAALACGLMASTAARSAVTLTQANNSAASPVAVAFGNVQVGYTASQTVTVTQGATAATVAIALTGTGLTQTNTCPTGTATLAAAATCTITVNFVPATAVATTGTLTVTSGTATASAVTGTGIAVGSLSAAAFASDLVAYPTAVAQPYLRSIQNGNLTTFAGGCYSFANAGAFSSSLQNIAYDEYYTLQEGRTATCAATDGFGYTLNSPNSAGAPAAVPLKIPNATSIIVRTGNVVGQSVSTCTTGCNGAANVFTIVVDNYSLTGVAPTSNAAQCSYNLTLNPTTPTSGSNQVYTPAGTKLPLTSQNGLWTYQIPLSAFTCSTGSVSLLTGATGTGVNNVAVKILATNQKSTKYGSGSIDAIALSEIKFQ